MRIDKFKMSNLANGLMIQHNQRTEKTAETRKFSNELIDKTKTHLNYGLLDQNRGLSYLKEQLNGIYIEQIRELEHQVERLEKEAKQSKILYDKVLEVLPAVIKNNLRCSPERAEKIAQTVRENAKARAKRQKNKEITKQYSQDRQKEHNQRTGLQEQINQAQQQRQAQQPRKRENHQFNSPSR